MKLFVRKEEDVSGGWRKLLNEDVITCTIH